MGCTASIQPSIPMSDQPLQKLDHWETDRASTPNRDEFSKNVPFTATSKYHADNDAERNTVDMPSNIVGDSMQKANQATGGDLDHTRPSTPKLGTDVVSENISDKPFSAACTKDAESIPGCTKHSHSVHTSNDDKENVMDEAETEDHSKNLHREEFLKQAPLTERNPSQAVSEITEPTTKNAGQTRVDDEHLHSPTRSLDSQSENSVPHAMGNTTDDHVEDFKKSSTSQGSNLDIGGFTQESVNGDPRHLVGKSEVRLSESVDDVNYTPGFNVDLTPEGDATNAPNGRPNDGGDKKASTKDLKWNLLRGNVNVDCPRTAKIVRVFLSSTFTDTKNERDLLLDDTYTRMKKKCKAKGYEFQLVDMRWGVVQSIDNSHMTGELCISEIEQCQKLSTGPNFVTLLSHKYGYFAYPRTIEKTKFDKLVEFISSEETESLTETDLDLIKKWYLLDENSLPPCYVLQPISTHFPDFMSGEREVYKATKRKWSGVCDRIVNILVDAAERAFQDGSFVIGVTDFENRRGILENDARSDTCLWLKRQIRGLEEDVGQKHKNKYIDSLDGSDWAERNKTLMRRLVNELTEKLPEENVVSFSISWKPEAISPQDYDEHREYLGEFCYVFEERVMRMFNKALQASRAQELGDPLLEEIAQHTRLCQDKCRDFCGRVKELKKLKMCVNTGNRTTLVFGESGSGKTSIMAALTKECWDWFGATAVIVTRFVGATPESSRIGTLMASIIRQINKAYDQNVDIPMEYDQLCEAFTTSIKLATPDKKLFIFLDSFEQLDPLEEAMNFNWIPDPLHDNVKMVISITKADNIFSKLKTSLNKSPLIEIKPFTPEEATKAFEEWFSETRTLTDSQTAMVKTAVDTCRLPLFLRLTFDEVYAWTSYMPTSHTVLQLTADSAIEAFFSRIEQAHGQRLVANALGYLTLAKRGLSESELEDILSCEDEVLDELYVYWEPPVRRLPPLILVRLRRELDRYIAQREVEGTPVMLWNHHHFREVSQKRYCSNEDFRKNIFQGLADFFAGTWSGDTKKPYKKKQQDGSFQELFAKRKVATQPLFFDDRCNSRKVNNLPWCLTEVGDSDKLASECLCSLDFLLAKLKHVGIRFLLDDFVDAVSKFKDEEFKQIKLALQLSQKALQQDANQLPAQLIARLSYNSHMGSQKLNDLLQKCHNAPFPVLVSSEMKLEIAEPNLTHSLPAHTSKVVGFDLSKSGDKAITLCCSGQLKVWNSEAGHLERSIDVPLDASGDREPKPVKSVLAFNDQVIVVVTEVNLYLYGVDTGRRLEKLSFGELRLDNPAVCVGGDAQGNELIKNAYIGVFSDSVWHLYNAKSLALKAHRDIGSLERGRLGLESLCAGSSRYMAVTDEDRRYLRTFSIKDRSPLQTRRVFPAFVVPDNPEGHGYEIQCLTFTSDGTTVLVANRHENEILFLDAETLDETKRLRGHEVDSPTAYRLTGDGSCVVFPSKQNVVVRSLNVETYRESVARHPVSVVFAATSDANRLVTLAEDGVLRLWNDLDLKVKSWAGGADALEGETEIRCMELLRSTSRYAVCVEVSPETRHLAVCDLYSGQTVRRAKLNPAMINVEIEILSENDEKVTCLVKRPCGHICEVDLQFMKVIRELDVRVAEPGDETKKTFRVVTFGKEQHLIVLDYSGLKIDLFHLSTEKRSNIFTSQSETIFGFLVCESQLTLVVDVDQEFHVVDVVTRSVKCVIPSDSFTDDVDLLGISEDGKSLVFSGTDDGKLRCWNVIKDQPFPELDFYGDATDDQTDTLIVEHVAFLGTETLACSFKDGSVRICNLSTGKCDKLASSHVGEVMLSSRQQLHTFLSYGIEPKDQTMALWSKSGSEYKQVASYTLDNPLEPVMLGRDGSFVVSGTQSPARVVTWHVEGSHKHNNSAQTQQANDKVLFRDSNLTLTFDLMCDKHDEVGSLDIVDDDDDRDRAVKTPDSLDW